MNRVRGFSTQRREFSSFNSSSRKSDAAKRNTKPSTGRRSLANVAWQPEEYSKVGLVRPKTKTKTNPPLLGSDWCRKRWLCACKQASKSSAFPRLSPMQPLQSSSSVIIICPPTGSLKTPRPKFFCLKLGLSMFPQSMLYLCVAGGSEKTDF